MPKKIANGFLLFKRVFLLVSAFSCSAILAQNSPDYNERSVLNDKLIVPPVSQMQQSVATEGVIDQDEYKVGPGDKFVVVVSGISETSYDASVNLEGLVYIPRVGIVEVDGKSLREAKTAIKQKLQEVFRNVNIMVSLVGFKTIKINIVGNVSRSSAYSIPANNRILDVVTGSSIVQGSSDLRNIKVISRDGTEKIYDMIAFLRLGEKSQNPLICEGDMISIDRSDKTVSIIGNVKNPGTYEYKENETVDRLIRISGGFFDSAFLDSIEVACFLDDNKTLKSSYYSYEELCRNPVTLKRGDKIIVRNKPEYLVDQLVSVSGFVQYPGTYKIIKDKTLLSELIKNEVKGFLPEAALSEAYVIRSSGGEETDIEYERLKTIPRNDMSDEEYDYLKAKTRHKKGRMIIDFKRLFVDKDNSEDLILKKGDQIVVPEKKNYITMVGQVVRPGNILYNKKLSIEDYIDLAGGFGWRAVESDVRVIKAANHEWVDADDIDSLEPGDIIWVPEDTPPPKFWNVFTTTLGIMGQVATVIAATFAVVAASK